MTKSKQQAFLETLKDPVMAKMKETIHDIIDKPNTSIINVDYIDVGDDFLTIDVRMRLGGVIAPHDD